MRSPHPNYDSIHKGMVMDSWMFMDFNMGQFILPKSQGEASTDA